MDTRKTAPLQLPWLPSQTLPTPASPLTTVDGVTPPQQASIISSIGSRWHLPLSRRPPGVLCPNSVANETFPSFSKAFSVYCGVMARSPGYIGSVQPLKTLSLCHLVLLLSEPLSICLLLTSPSFVSPPLVSLFFFPSLTSSCSLARLNPPPFFNLFRFFKSSLSFFPLSIAALVFC